MNPRMQLLWGRIQKKGWRLERVFGRRRTWIAVYNDNSTSDDVGAGRFIEMKGSPDAWGETVAYVAAHLQVDHT